MDFTGRFNKLLTERSLTNYRLAIDLGISQTTVKNYKDGRTVPNALILEQLARYFDVSRHWLETGEGDMEPYIPPDSKKLKPGKEARQVSIDLSDMIVAPLIGQYAYAGYINSYGDHEYLEQQPHYISMHQHTKGNYVAFEVRGDSMDDDTRRSICKGDIVLGRELYKPHWLSKLHIPKVFIIVHDTGIVIKEVIEHDVENGIITCHSWNPDPEYEDYKVSLQEVRQLFYIKEISRVNKF